MFMSPGSPVQGFAGHACHRDIFSEGVNNFHVFRVAHTRRELRSKKKERIASSREGPRNLPKVSWERTQGRCQQRRCCGHARSLCYQLHHVLWRSRSWSNGCNWAGFGFLSAARASSSLSASPPQRLSRLGLGRMGPRHLPELRATLSPSPPVASGLLVSSSLTPRQHAVAPRGLCWTHHCRS